MPTSPRPSLPARGVPLRALFGLVLCTLALTARADCDIPQTATADKPFDAEQVMLSFYQQDCTVTTFDQDKVFYRYYSFPHYPSINIGRFLTLDFFTINSEAIVKLALFPFPPNPQFQNFAYYREQVLVAAGLPLYLGLAGPQPVDEPDSCYAGGASQYFFAGENISTNPAITFGPAALMTRDTRYTNQYGVGDPCNVVPLPGTVMLLGIGAFGLLGVIRLRRHG